MAGVGRAAGGRSGRPRSGEEPRFAPSSPPPELTDSYGSVGRFLAWLAREGAAGNIPPRVIDALASAAKGMTSCLRTEHAEGELAELRALTERMEAACSAQLVREARARDVATFAAPAQPIGRVRDDDCNKDP